MKDKYFLDTNIFVYSFDKSDMIKMEKAQSIIKQALERRNAYISTQIIQEFSNVATKKFYHSMKAKDLKIYVNEVLFPLCSVFPNFDLLTKSIDIFEKYKYSYYDSLIISAAIFSGANILLSEDLKDKQKIEGITILNPFF